MKRFKVLHVVRPAAGGMKGHLLSLLKHTDRELFEPWVAGPPGEMLSAAENSGFNVFPLPLRGEIDLINDSRVVLRLARFLKAKRFEILHAHGSKAGLVGRLAAMIAGTPVVFFTAHSSILYPEWPEFKKKAYVFAEKCLARRTNRVIAVSEALRRELIEREGMNPGQVVAVYNGINPGDFQTEEPRESIRVRLGLPVDRPVVGAVARLAPQKGLNYLIEAAALISPGERPLFVVVGDGPLRAELEALVAKRGAGGHFIFTGSRDDVPVFLKAFDILALPSLTEALGLAVLEAMAASLPVIATAVGGIPEVVVHGETGILVPPRDAVALAKGVTELLAAPERAASFGVAGRKRVCDLFTVEKMAGRVMDLYREALTAQGLLF
ncbi:MAG: glycosyltransferase family 4 protein [Bacillota bacterium]